MLPRIAAAAILALGVRLLGRRGSERRRDEAIARALLSDDTALDEQIARLFHSQTRAQEEAFARWLRQPIRVYLDTKKAIIAAPGKGLAILLRDHADGGESFCRKVRYCERSAKLKKDFAALKDFSEDAIPAAGQLADVVADRFPEALDFARDVLEVFADEALDAFFVPLIARGIHSGLEEICRCCVKCSGSGKLGQRKCAACNGAGTEYGSKMKSKVKKPAPPSPGTRRRP